MSDLLDHDRLVFRQRAKLVELTNEFDISDEDGSRIGYVREEGQSKLKKALRFATKVDQFLTHRLAVYEDSGTKLLELTRPAKVFKSRVEVTGGSGDRLGEIIQNNVFGKIRFDLDGRSGESLGQIRAENWVAWDFAIVDQAEQEVARITKKWVGLTKAIFTTADNYVLEMDNTLSGELRLLTLAAAVAVDTALKQDDRGFSLT